MFTYYTFIGASNVKCGEAAGPESIINMSNGFVQNRNGIILLQYFSIVGFTQ